MRTIVCGALLGLVALPLAGVAGDGNRSPQTSIEALLAALRDQTGVPAYSVAIAREGELVAAAAVGEIDVRNRTPATTETWFRLASVSKIVGGTMLALLVEAGELDPNAPIGRYLDDLPEQFRGITTLELLAHTSGMPHYQPRDAAIAATHYDSAVETLASVGNRPLIDSPGSAYLYSSHGYTILGALHESISGVPIDESVPAFIGKLTGRESPALENILERNRRRSNVFDVGADGAVTLKPRDQSYSPFGTGMVASAPDLALFGDAVLRSPLIADATRELLFHPVTLDDGSPTGNYLYEVAFGWRVGRDAAGRRIYHHSGVTQGARSTLILYPDAGLSIAFLSNASWVAQIERTAMAFANFVLDGQVPGAADIDADFAGTYDGRAIDGTLGCDTGADSCLLSDRGGALSEWLSQHRPGDGLQSDWHFMPVHGNGGRALKLVTSVGIVELREAVPRSSGRFAAEIGNGRLLEFDTSD